MKKIFIMTCALAFSLMSFIQDSPISKEEGMTVINTTTLCKDVKGYVDGTPVKIYVQDGKIVKVKPLRTKETPGYYSKVKQAMLSKWVGMTTQKAAKAKVDGVTGATMSSKCLLKNVQTGCDYYNKHK